MKFHKKFKNLLYQFRFPIVSFLAAFSLISCEKVIDIDLNDSAPKLVVEAVVGPEAGSAAVFLTKSINFKQTEIPVVGGAQITVEDLTSHTVYSFSEIDPGVYINASLKSVAGHSYKLTIQSEGKTYTAHSGFNHAVNLDNLEQKTFSNSALFANLVEITPKFTDPANTENYYQLQLVRNDTIQKDILLMNDVGYDGLMNTRSLIIEAKKNDVVELELQSIDKAVYNYMIGYKENLINYSATPANPPSNITNGALGYFKVHSSSVKQIVIN